ncbi:hypothetical protein M3P21_07580 [Ruegeria sp. 2012CJ41-6]|uniref:Uncharacterized protein n=1 Tax=Ruegeria spongiae TaxID=2942209 RepID=A0ABT0Q1D0_9RHOB|nr:hypothetical protein [Ruegeria spongiae]MCL6283392.1 hypothetical protein [Ruegeria spongiae]
MIEVFLAAMATIALALYGQIRMRARNIRRNRARQQVGLTAPSLLDRG